MSSRTLLAELKTESRFLPQTETTVTIEELSEEDCAEVLAFLAERPVHTVIMAGWIRDNGVVSPLNRGTFYGCRGSGNTLEGVALIGHVTLLEVRTDRALQAFARAARNYAETHLVMGEQQHIKAFWESYQQDGRPVRRALRETLFELRSPVAEKVGALKPRLAELSDLHLIMPAQAQMAFEESGVDPREVDPDGFRQRCARRIEQRRVWVVTEEDGELLFKADVISETPHVFYLEGVYVAERARGWGLGTSCMTELSNHLLTQTQSICVLVNEQNHEAQSFYRNIGFEVRDTYDTIFLRKKQPAVQLTVEREVNRHVDARPLRERDRVEVLEWLGRNPARSVILAGFIHDHGAETEVNGSRLYGYWNSAGDLEGVALIGRSTVFEASTDDAIRALATVAKKHPRVAMIMATDEELQQFWELFKAETQVPGRRCEAVLYEYNKATGLDVHENGLRRAELSDLDQVIVAHAAMVHEESGVDPLQTDAEGFRKRCAARIEQGRVWVLIKDGQLLFKADLVAETPESAYLEGLWVSPAYRKQGYGLSSVAMLSRVLLADKFRITGFVNAQNLRAQAFYEKAGCIVRARFTKLYL